MPSVESTVKRLRTLVELCGTPSRIEPGPVSQHVMVRWNTNDAGMVSVEFDVQMAAGEAVELLRQSIERHDWWCLGLSAGGWQFECKKCEERCETEVATGVGGDMRYGCKGS